MKTTKGVMPAASPCAENKETTDHGQVVACPAGDARKLSKPIRLSPRQLLAIQILLPILGHLIFGLIFTLIVAKISQNVVNANTRALESITLLGTIQNTLSLHQSQLAENLLRGSTELDDTRLVVDSLAPFFQEYAQRGALDEVDQIYLRKENDQFERLAQEMHHLNASRFPNTAAERLERRTRLENFNQMLGGLARLVQQHIRTNGQWSVAHAKNFKTTLTYTGWALLIFCAFLTLLYLLVSFWIVRQAVARLARISSELAKLAHTPSLPERLDVHAYAALGGGGAEMKVFLDNFDALILRFSAEMKNAQDARALSEQYLAASESERAQLDALLQAMHAGVCFIDSENRVLFHNAQFRTLWGIAPGEKITRHTVHEVLHLASNRPPQYDFSRYQHDCHAFTQGDVNPGDLLMREGQIIEQQCYQVKNTQGHSYGFLWLYEDVTATRQHQERLAFLAEHDSLTGLYNRLAFQEQIKARMAEIQFAREGHCALFCFNIDEFRYINDTHGHEMGDQLLRQVANMLSGLIRNGECLARLGGDEFAVFFTNRSEANLRLYAEQLVQAIAHQDFLLGNGQIQRVSISTGVAIYPDHAQDAKELFAHADIAMYQAKQAGKNTWRIYQASEDDTAHRGEYLKWNERIQHALETEGFVLYFQGIHHVRSHQAEHLEALIRMKDPENPGQLLSPSQFIPVAEKSGKILEIDRWVIERSIRTLSEHPTSPPIAINISGRSFDDPSLPGFIAERLEHYAVSAASLMVELTETAAVSDMTEAHRFIGALSQIGCKVCLDDFGAGFSSFAYLKHLPVDILKIDGLFIRDLANNYDSQVFMRGIASIAQSLGKHTIAEFVENEESLRLLLNFGVDFAQGYYLSRPTHDLDSLLLTQQAA